MNNLEDLDLQLQCQDGSVAVNSLLLLSGVRPPMFDIITMLRKENPDATGEEPMTLDCKGDDLKAWEEVWAILKAPLAERTLPWETLRTVIRLADKYEIVTVLAVCETHLTTVLAAKPAVAEDAESPFGRIQLEPEPFLLDLPFLELIWQARLMRAYRLLEPYYVQTVIQPVMRAGAVSNYAQAYKAGHEKGYRDAPKSEAPFSFCSVPPVAVPDQGTAHRAKLTALNAAFAQYVANASASPAKVHVMNTLITQLLMKLAQQ